MPPQNLIRSQRLPGSFAKQTTCSTDVKDSWSAKRHPAPTSRILGQQTFQRQPPGSSASKRQRQPRGSLSRKQALAPTSHIAKLPAQSANQAPISLASGSLVGEFVDQIASVKTYSMPPQNLIRSQRLPGSFAEQTTCITDFEDSWLAKRHQRQPRGSPASKPPQDSRQANDSANPQDPCPTNEPERHIAKSPAQSAHQGPISLASGSLVCEFVDQIATTD